MERFFIVFFTLFIAYGCSNFNIIPARPYVDIEPSREVLVPEVKYNNIWERIFIENNFVDDPLPDQTEKYVKRFVKNKKHFNELILNGEYYLFEVLEELDRYRLPS